LLFIRIFFACVSVYFTELIYMLRTIQFFEMQRDDAIRALDMYKRAISQVNLISFLLLVDPLNFFH